MVKNTTFYTFTIVLLSIVCVALFYGCGNSPEELYNKGMSYVKGDGVEKNIEKGVALLKQSADKGYLPAFRQVGSVLMNNGSVQEGLRWYELAIEKGDAEAAMKLAFPYYDGNDKYGIQQNGKKALSLFEKAIELDEKVMDSECYACMANCYYYGIDIDVDNKKAAQYYQRAIEFDDVPEYAYTNLGAIYYEGVGVSKDYSKAVEFFKMAAERNDPNALWNLAVCYDNGQGVSRNHKTAVEYIKKAAKLGHQSALDYLAY